MLIAAAASATTLAGVLYRHWLVVKNTSNYIADGDYISQSAALRVEPITAISKDLDNHPSIDDILETNLTLVCSFYTAAMQIKGVIKDVKVLKTLSSLNPEPSLDNFSAESVKHTLCKESYGTNKEDYQFGLPLKSSLESASLEYNQVSTEISETKVIGKEIDIMLTDTKTEDGKTNSHKVKVMLRLVGKSVSNNTLVKVMSQYDSSKEAGERWHAVKTGRISFIKDFIFNMDIYEERKKLMMSDDVDFYKTIMERSHTSKVVGALNENPHMASATNVYIISSDVEREIEASLRGKFTSMKTRNRIFDITKAMLISIVDLDRDKLIIWYRGLEDPTILKLGNLKSKSKKLDDMYEIIKTLAAYKTPSF